MDESEVVQNEDTEKSAPRPGNAPATSTESSPQLPDQQYSSRPGNAPTTSTESAPQLLDQQYSARPQRTRRPPVWYADEFA
ncbi:hypothetical protein V5799_015276 [Amblyomma americanum]|uniref:Uncharacterized protein n=1 Tax=Amblyomma americanum TaxID=6943 RepID=A0AAQ4E0L9_AMBAM